MLYILYITYCTLHTVHYILYITYCTLHTVHYILYITYCTLHTVHYILYITYCTLHTVHYILYITYCTLHTVHYILYITYCTLHTATFSVQALPQCVASIRNVHSQCPKEVLSFLWDLFKYSDNQMNKVLLLLPHSQQSGVICIIYYA